MASWIAKPWIEQALMSETGKNLPKIARAQILKFDETSHYTIAFISDKEFFVKAVFSPAAVEQFKRDNPTLSMADIQGGLIFIKKYSFEASCTTEKDLSTAEFVMKIDLFKFAGGEGNTQFGSDIIDSSKYSPLQPRLHELCTLSQFKTLLYDKSFDAREAEGGNKLSSIKTLERTLLENHEPVFIPEHMEKKLARIPEWQPSYRPPLSCNMQSEMTSFGDTPSSGRGQTQISASSMAVDCGQSLQVQEKMVIPKSLSSTENRNFSQSQTASKVKGFRTEKTVEETIGGKSQKTSDWTRVACSLQKSSTRQQESSSLFKEIKDALASISTPEKQNKREETVFRFDDTAAYLETCRKSVISCSLPTREEQSVASSSQRELKPTTKQTDVKRLETWEFLDHNNSNDIKEKARSGNCLKMLGKNILSSKGPASYVPKRSSRAGMLQGLGQYHFPEYHVKGKENELATEQEEIAGGLISSDVVSSSQMSGKLSPPLKGVIAEDQCSSFSEQLQLKGSNEESFSILKERSLPSTEKKSPEIFVVPSSDNSEECEQALPSILPGHTDKHLCCSLSESQLENLLESSISYDLDSAPPCAGNETRESQEGGMYTKIKQGPLTQRESTSQGNQRGNTKANPDSSQLKNSTASEPCIASKKDLSPIHNMAHSALKEKLKHKGKSLEVHKHGSNSTTVRSNIDQTLSKPMTMNFDKLFSQNTWHFSQISDRQLSVNEAETDSHQSIKRKRSEMEGHVHSIPPSVEDRQRHKVLLSGSPASPDCTSHSVKCDIHSGSSQNHISSLSPSIYLTKPMELYSQQDPLVLNSSTESLENIDGVINNDSGLLINGNDSHNGHGDTSPSTLEHSIKEPSTLMTPTFDSLPSFQVPADNRETPTSRVQKHKVGHSATRYEEAETHQDPGNKKKKRKRRSRKFNWFSDSY